MPDVKVHEPRRPSLGGLGFLVFSVCLIALATLTPGRGAAGDGRDFLCSWHCLGSPSLPADFIRNVLLFLPVGIGVEVGLPWRIRRRAVLVIIIASLLIEIVQGTMIGGRSSSLLDVVANGLGVGIGVWVLSDRWRLLRLARSRRVGLAIGWLGLHGVLALGTWELLRPTAPDTPVWFGQWAHTFPATAAFRGHVLDFTLAGTRIPDGPIATTGRLRSAFVHERFAASLRFVLDGAPHAASERIPHAAARRRRQIAGVADGRGGMVMDVSSIWNDLLVKVHRRADDSGFPVPAMRFANLLKGSSGDSVDLHIVVQSRFIRSEVSDGKTVRSLSWHLGPWDSGLLILGSDSVTLPVAWLLRAGWLLFLLGPVCYLIEFRPQEDGCKNRRGSE